MIDMMGRLGAPQLTANTRVDADITETNNRFYLDASLLFEDVLRPKLDIRVSGKNLLDNRDPVGGPWLRGSYLPRGATLEVALYLEF